MKKKEKYKINGVVGTVLFHGIILLLLILLGFTTELPLPGEEGVEVSLGSGTEGMGRVQPRKPDVIEKITPPPPVEKQVEEEIVTQNTETAPVIEQKKEEKKPEQQPEKPKEEVPEKPVEKKPEVNPNALYKGKSKEPNEANSEGITGKEGDQGKPEGSIDSKEYLGKGGFGDGLSYSLAGREAKFLPKPSTNFSENGTVVVQITVNRYGKVIKAVAIDKGSNTTNLTLRKLAEQAAMRAVFNVDTDAAEMQRGTVTYHFVVKN